MNPSRCRWVEMKVGKIKATPQHFPWAKRELGSQADDLPFSEAKHIFPKYELLKACYTGRKGKTEIGLTSVNAVSTFLYEPTPTSNPALSNSPALKRKEKQLDPIA